MSDLVPMSLFCPSCSAVQTWMLPRCTLRSDLAEAGRARGLGNALSCFKCGRTDLEPLPINSLVEAKP